MVRENIVTTPFYFLTYVMIIRNIVENSNVPSIDLLKLSDTGILKEIFPELSALDYVYVSKTSKIHKNNFYHTLQVLDNVAKISTNPILRWAAVLHDIGKSKTQEEDQESGNWTFYNHNLIGYRMVPGILKMHNVPDEWQNDIKNLVLLHMRPVTLIKEPVTESAVRRVITEAGPQLNDLMCLAEADITSRYRDKYLDNMKIVRKMMNDVISKDYWENLNPVINGNWIMEHCILHDNSEIGVIKDHLKHLIADKGYLNTFEALYPEFLKIIDSLKIKLRP